MEWFTPDDVYGLFKEKRNGRVWSDEACEYLSHKYNDNERDWYYEDDARRHLLGWWELERNDDCCWRLKDALDFFDGEGYISWHAPGAWSGPSNAELFDKLVKSTQNLNSDYMVKFSPTHILLRAGGTPYDNSPFKRWF